MPNVITYDQLVEKKACYRQLVLFKRMFGDSVDLTLVEYDDEKHGHFQFEWAVLNLLDVKSFKKYRSIQNKAFKNCMFEGALGIKDYYITSNKAFILCYLAMGT